MGTIEWKTKTERVEGWKRSDEANGGEEQSYDAE